MATFKRAIGRKIVKTSHLPLQAEKDIKRMEEEIETLREQLEYCNRHREAAVNKAIKNRENKNEWKRRTKTVLDTIDQLPGSIMSNEASDLTKPLVPVSYKTAILHIRPEIGEWFEE